MCKIFVYFLLTCMTCSCTLADVTRNNIDSQSTLDPEELYASDRLSYRYKNEILNTDNDKTDIITQAPSQTPTNKQQSDFATKEYEAFRQWQAFQEYQKWLNEKHNQQIAK